MGHFGFLKRFFREALGYVETDDDAVEQAGEASSRHATYHKRIVLVAIVFGVIGVLCGIGFIASVFLWPKPGDDTRLALLSPLLFGAAGVLYGVAVACLFAPRPFLEGPMGKKWMTLVGTKSVFGVRIVCMLLSLIPFAAAALIYWDQMRRAGRL